MPQVMLNQEAPDFTLRDFTDKPFTLSDLREQKAVLLVFNRGFV